MSQIDIWPVASHSNDPLSSYKAEGRVTKSGKRASGCEQVLACLKKQDNITGAELAQRWGFEVYEARRRLSDLKAQGKAIQSGKRICRIAGTEAVTWRIV